MRSIIRQNTKLGMARVKACGDPQFVLVKFDRAVSLRRGGQKLKQWIIDRDIFRERYAIEPDQQAR